MLRSVALLVSLLGVLVLAQNASFSIRMRYPSTDGQTFGIRGEGAALPGHWGIELPLQRVSDSVWQIKLTFPVASVNTRIAFKVTQALRAACLLLSFCTRFCAAACGR